MKLKSKLTLGVISTLLLALFACCTMSIAVSKNSILKSTITYSELELEKLKDNLWVNRQDIEQSTEELTMRAVLRYCFFQQTQYSDDNTEYVLINENGDSIYNNSGVNPEAIMSLGTDEAVKTEIVRFAESDYLVCGKTCSLNNTYYHIYLIRNVTSIFVQLRQLSFIYMAIGLSVCMIAGAVIIFFLRKELEPLEQMKREAEAIAEGQYSARLKISGKDELAHLSRSFNQMAESVEHHILEVEKTSEARNRLIHALSHEMRTPVTAISGYSYALRSVRMNEEQKTEALEFIDLEAKRLERLSGKMTELIGLSENKIQLQTIHLADMKKQLEMIFQNQNTIRLQIEEGSMLGDQDLLILVITNLCDNARKAGATEITVEVSPMGIWVKDNGKGISESDRERIFEAFYQGDASRNQEGFGLGLALCQKVAELHHTRLQVNSVEGKGSTFYLYNSLTTL
ncbi:MAG: HAMP domain-containing sensor histidine kinase [Clostridiales bacterium]|nr:HAMP domain-containing sensor histidine kinase [Clostridiales bacterium]